MIAQKEGDSLIDRPKISKIAVWLEDKNTDVPAKRYCHLLLVERPDKRNQVIDELARYFNFAHEPFRRQIRDLLGYSLNPLENKLIEDPAQGYPEDLHPITLQGYFGEVFAGLVAEHYEIFGANNWEVPVFLFHSHNVAFQQLELARQTGQKVKHVPGRTGDDCLAFERDDNGNIQRIMFCEAKCTRNHDLRMIEDAHIKLSTDNIRPVDLLKVIEALTIISDGEEVEKWINSLRRVYFKKETVKERCDMSVYVCGEAPKRKETHISTRDPHHEYTGKRRLISVEAHLNDVEHLVKIVYENLKRI